MPVTIDCNAIGSSDKERQRVRAWEAIARTAQKPMCRFRGREQWSVRARTAGLDGEEERRPHVLVVEGDREPLRRPVLDGPRLLDVLVERVQRDDDQREVDERQQRGGGCSPQDHQRVARPSIISRLSNAPRVASATYKVGLDHHADCTPVEVAANGMLSATPRCRRVDHVPAERTRPPERLLGA